jgi:hypothetical protein
MQDELHIAPEMEDVTLEDSDDAQPNADGDSSDSDGSFEGYEEDLQSALKPEEVMSLFQGFFASHGVSVFSMVDAHLGEIKKRV